MTSSSSGDICRSNRYRVDSACRSCGGREATLEANGRIGIRPGDSRGTWKLGAPLAVRTIVGPTQGHTSGTNIEPAPQLSIADRVRASIARPVGRMRGRHLLAIDTAGVALAIYLALAFRYNAEVAVTQLSTFAPVLFVLIASRVVMNIRFGLYARGWRFASVPELERILLAALAGSVAAVLIVYGLSLVPGVTWTANFPRSFWAAELLVMVAVLGGARFGIRAAAEWTPKTVQPMIQSRRATLLYGAGRTGALMAASAERKPDAGVLPVGFLDDDANLAGGKVGELPIFGGLDSLDKAVAATGAEVLLITMPNAPGKSVRRVLDAASARGLDVRTIPSMNDLLDGTLDAYRVRRVEVEDLLRRPTATEHAADVRSIVEGQTVVITGAGGSIGSELARQVFSLRPARLVLVDRAESALYLVQRDLEARATRGQGAGEIRVHLANVASRAVMDRMMRSERPDVIFHAAAYKHVPMMEEHPSDAVHVNIGGTLAVLDAAEAAGVARFVFVSTDKAVRPSSVMGASKRVAEMLVSEAAARTGNAYVSVRFGNVLGSTGSVVPIFHEQLEKSEPITITHAEMTRYFMTIAEAAWLILDAAAIGEKGDLFVLSMGEPVRIVDLARDLIRLAGRDPESQPIEFVGLRPGEKLHEELFYDTERVEPTAVSKVLRAIAGPPPASLKDDVGRLIALATGATEDDLRVALLDYTRAVAVPTREEGPSTATGSKGASLVDESMDDRRAVIIPA